MMKGKLIHENFGDREVTVYLPPSWKKNSTSYPLLMVQDGDYLFRSNLEQLEHWFDNSRLQGIVFAGITTANRLDEYTPWPAPALTDVYPDFGGRGDEYVDFLVAGLMPYLQQKYNTGVDWTQTGIAGASLGGLISLYAACKHRDIFGRIGLLSTSFWYKGILSYLADKAELLVQGQGGRRIYMSVGSMEGVGKTSVQKDMTPLTVQAADILRKAGIQQDQLRFELVEGGIHQQSWFISRFPAAVEWLFAK